jgi:hypothetical protein
MTRPSRIPALLCLLALTGCNSATAPDTVEPPEPAFLIGGSPLIQFVKLTDGTRVVEYETTMNRGILEAKTEDRFWIRTTTRFTKDGSEVADLGGCIEKPTPLKQAELNRGGSVGIIMDISIPDDPEWLAIIAAAAGGLIDVHLKIELLLEDGAGKIHVLDTVNASAPVDPGPAI